MSVKAIIFDLDGTLTYTLQDLCDSVNYALRQMGWPERSLEEVRSFVGNGVRRLVECSVPCRFVSCDPVATDRCFAIFQKHYLEHCQDNTRLYEGVAEMLQAVRQRGYKTAVVSNKLQAGVDELRERFFDDWIDVAIGQRDGVPLKPAPDMVELALKALGTTREEAVYVGDSEVDVATARNSGLPCVSVLWGFRDRDVLLEAGARVFINHPSELLEILK